MALKYTIDDLNPLIKYEPAGEWWIGTVDTDRGSNYFGFTKTWTNSPNAQASFKFYGSYVCIYGAKRGNHGIYHVVLDGDKVFDGNGFEPDPGRYRQVLFERRDLAEGQHTVVVKNGEDRFLDIDQIEWRTGGRRSKTKEGEDEESGDDRVTETETIIESDPAFSWGPSGAWDRAKPNMTDFLKPSAWRYSTRTGATCNISFSGDTIAVYGTVGPQSSTYSIIVDDTYIDTFNATRDMARARPDVLLYQAGHLGPGEHVLRVVNQDEGKELAISRAVVRVAGSTTTSESSSLSSSLSTATAIDAGPVEKESTNVPLITGLTVGLVALTIMLFLFAWCMHRRNKRLWTRLQTDEIAGVKAPFTNNPSSRDPLLSTARGHMQEWSGFTTSSGSSGLSWAKARRYELSESDTAYQPLILPREEEERRQMEEEARNRERRREPPMRSGTTETNSTLVAEAGSEGGSEPVRAATLKLLPQRGYLGRPRDTPPPPTIPLPQLPPGAKEVTDKLPMTLPPLKAMAPLTVTEILRSVGPAGLQFQNQKQHVDASQSQSPAQYVYAQPSQNIGFGAFTTSPTHLDELRGMRPVDATLDMDALQVDLMALASPVETTSTAGTTAGSRAATMGSLGTTISGSTLDGAAPGRQVFWVSDEARRRL